MQTRSLDIPILYNLRTIQSFASGMKFLAVGDFKQRKSKCVFAHPTCGLNTPSASSQSIANSNGQWYIEQLGILWPLKYSRVYHYLGAKKTRAVGFCQAITDMIKYGVIVKKNTPKLVPLVQVRGRREIEPLFYIRLHIERYYNSSILTR